MFWVLIETVLLSTHNICFGLEIKKIVFHYTLLSGGLISTLFAGSHLTGGIGGYWLPVFTLLSTWRPGIDPFLTDGTLQYLPYKMIQ